MNNQKAKGEYTPTETDLVGVGSKYELGEI